MDPSWAESQKGLAAFRARGGPPDARQHAWIARKHHGPLVNPGHCSVGPAAGWCVGWIRFLRRFAFFLFFPSPPLPVARARDAQVAATVTRPGPAWQRAWCVQVKAYPRAGPANSTPGPAWQPDSAPRVCPSRLPSWLLPSRRLLGYISASRGEGERPNQHPPPTGNIAGRDRLHICAASGRRSSRRRSVCPTLLPPCCLSI